MSQYMNMSFCIFKTKITKKETDYLKCIHNFGKNGNLVSLAIIKCLIERL